MPNISVQLRRGTTTEHNTFTGAEGEVTVDTDLDTLRVHDGSTAGGVRLAKHSELAGAAGNTDLSNTPAASSVDIESSTGTNTTVAGATTSLAGVMTGADKTKLNGIETGATADQTASEILTAVKTVDGTGSGLDADLLDGQHASAFAASSHTHTAANITDFDTEVANNTAVAANTAKVSNATHTGDVTGSTALTIANGAVTPAKTAFDNLAISNTSGGSSLTVTGTTQAFIEVGGAASNLAYIDIKNPTSDDYDLRLVSDDRTPMASVHQSRARVEGVTSLGLCAGTAGGPLSEIVTVTPTEIFIKNSTAVPTTNPTGGGFLYVDSGDLKYRDPNGNVKDLDGGPAVTLSKWDSGWVNQDDQTTPVSVANSATLIFDHDLGTDVFMPIVQIWMATDSAGSGPRLVPFEALRGGGDSTDIIEYGAQVTGLSSTQITIQLAQNAWANFNSSGVLNGSSWGTTYTHIRVVAIA